MLLVILEFVTVFVVFVVVLVTEANHIHRICMNSITLYYLVSADTLCRLVLQFIVMTIYLRLVFDQTNLQYCIAK
jgi:hypothetical protein